MQRKLKGYYFKLSFIVANMSDLEFKFRVVIIA